MGVEGMKLVGSSSSNSSSSSCIRRVLSCSKLTLKSTVVPEIDTWQSHVPAKMTLPIPEVHWPSTHLFLVIESQVSFSS